MFGVQVNSHCQQNNMSWHLPYLIGREISLFYLSILSSPHHEKFGSEEYYKRRCETQPQGKSNSKSTGHFLEKAAPCPGKACGSSAFLPLSVLLGQALLFAVQSWITYFLWPWAWKQLYRCVHKKIKWKQSIRRKPPSPPLPLNLREGFVPCSGIFTSELAIQTDALIKSLPDSKEWQWFCPKTQISVKIFRDYF